MSTVFDASDVFAAYSYESYGDADLLKVGLNKTAVPASWAVQSFIDDRRHYSYAEWMCTLDGILGDDKFAQACYDSRMNSLRELNYVIRSLQKEIGNHPGNDDTIREIAPWLLHIARTRVRLQINLSALEHDAVTAALKQYKAEAWPQTRGWDYV